MSKKKTNADVGWRDYCNSIMESEYLKEIDRWDWPVERSPRKSKPLSWKAAVKEAKAKGVEVTVEANGAFRFKSIPNVKNAQGNGAADDLDLELEEFEARHEA